MRVGFSGLVNSSTGDKIPASAFTCFNTEGNDVKGNAFDKNLSVAKDKVQALWIGVDLPERMVSGVYSGDVTVMAANAESKSVRLSLEISDNVIANHGDDEPWRPSLAEFPDRF